MRSGGTAASAVIVAVLLSGTALAGSIQDQPAPAASAATSSGQLEDIVVTAQRRAERLQDVPIAVTAVTSSALAQQGVMDAVQLSTVVPGLVATQPTPAPLLFLRGVGSNAANPNDEASVATYVDGVYMASPFANVMSFNNIERIEILKGPQGTLFGRNATGGVIQVVTRDPVHEPGLEAKFGYGNYEAITASFYATGGLSDTLAMDVAVQYDNQDKGFGRNITLDREVRKGNSFGARTKLLFEPTDRTSLRLSLDYGRDHNSYGDFRMPPGVLGINGTPTAQGQDTSTNVANAVESEQGGAALRIDQDVGFAQLTSISAYRKSSGSYTFDPDGTALNVIDGFLAQSQHNFTQELQLGSQSSARMQWLLGAFYYNNYAAYSRSRLAGLAFAPMDYIDPQANQRTKSFSVYGQGTAEVLPALELTLGARFTTERQTFNGGIPVMGFIAPELKQGFDRMTWRGALNYRFTDSIHAYVSYNRGVKSGGFDLLSPGVEGYRPEILDAYEIGFKSELFDRRLRANIALFQYEYQDIQVQSIVVGTIVTTNAAEARIKGIDFDFQAMPFENLTLTGALQLLDGKYLNFPNAISYPSSAFGTAPEVIDVSGNKTVRSPDYSWNLGANYDLPTNIGTFNIGGVISYNDGFYFAPDNVFAQKSYTIINGSLGWRSADGRLGLGAWMKNLTNRKYLAHGVPGSFGDLSAQAAPRTFGFTASVKL